MTDTEFLAALEGCTLPETEFTHAAHVRAAYLYLCSGSFGQAIDRMAAAIRRYAGSLGKPDRYHDTITVGFVALIRERICERGDGGGWPAFAAANPDLFDRERLLRHYSREQLQSPRARRVFVLPEAPRLAP
jgi:hypothetical protein